MTYPVQAPGIEVNIDEVLSQALASQRDGDPVQAEARFRAVLDAQPDNADAAYGLGTVLLQQRQTEQACGYLRRAVDLMPQIPEFAYNLGLAEDQAGRRKDAATHLHRAGLLAAGDTQLIAAACGKLLSMGRDAEVLAVVAATGCDDPSVLAIGARAQARRGDWAGACNALRSVISARPDDAPALRNLATAAARLRDYPTALSAFENYLRLVGDVGADYLAYADLLLMARRLDDATAAIQRAMDLGVDDADAQYIAARCDRMSGDYEAALERLRQATRGRPRFGSAWWLLVDLEVPGPALEVAAQTCRRLAHEPPLERPETVQLALSAGRALERLGRYDDAFNEFDFGNRQHEAQLRARGAAYDPAATERFVASMFRLYEHAPEASREHSRQPSPIFIVGLPRSGTTVVERMLAMLDGVTAGGENEAMEFVAASYYWELEKGRVPEPQVFSQAQRDALVSEYWQRSACEPCLMTDKLPHNFRNVGLIATLFPRSPIIYLHRDARDVAVSIYSRPFPDGHAYACNLAALGHFYAQSERLHRHWQTIMGQRLLDVSYEALVREPETIARRIVEFCGLRWDPACLQFHEHADASFTFSELQVREALNDRGVGRWRHYEHHLGPFMEALNLSGRQSA